MMTNFEKIRSMLEYGHKVEVKTKTCGYIFVAISPLGVLIDQLGGEWTQRKMNWESSFLSITPIPHRYKKLEVGTLVDVLEEYDNFSAKLNPYKIIEEGKCSCHVWIHSALTTIEVPLWAITPHVEEEKTCSCKGKIAPNNVHFKDCDLLKKIEPLEIIMKNDEVTNANFPKIMRKINELVEYINLQSTNN